MSLLDRLVAPGPKRILALDGGGIRGAITLGFLARIEVLLRERHGRPDLVLADYPAPARHTRRGPARTSAAAAPWRCRYGRLRDAHGPVRGRQARRHQQHLAAAQSPLAATAEALQEMDKAELRDVFNQIGRSAAPATIVDDTGREIQYGVEAAHLPAAFQRR